MEETTKILAEHGAAINNVWLLVAAFLVMLMQAGFALVEAGFTRAKNSANILMKNLMDFSFGSFIFWLVGFSIMFGSSLGGGILGNPGEFFGFGQEGVDGVANMSFLLFQTVFAATAATIVSGAMAERTKFSAYIVFSIVVTLVIYPISGHWAWASLYGAGEGWLEKLGFADFAGSTVVHSVGAWVGLAGAIVLGPRLGKYENGKAKAIPGHNLALGALGVFILWFGWFGFNPGSQAAAATEGDTIAIGHIAVTTNLAAAAGAISAMVLAWIRYKRPPLSLSLNGALAGLVAITAGCDGVSPTGAVMIGLIAGVLLVFAVELFDQKLKIDDPVGAISVHGINGAWGTLAVGLFNTESGLFYGGGASQLLTQFIGVAAVFVWAFGCGFILFKILKAVNGLRVSKRIEEEGLDVYEHGEAVYNM
jgi:Amt family ammonium transporter